MKRLALTLSATGIAIVGALALVSQVAAHGDADEDAEEHRGESESMGMHEEMRHQEEEGHHGEEGHHELEEMMEMHRGHEHEHDFAAMERLSPERRDRVLALMRDVGLALPPMDPERGRELFLEKGCVACHQINGVGGELGPTLNADDMPEPMNAFEFAARMWRGAPAMTELQNQLLGDPIELTGQELADIVAFAHDEQAQAKLSLEQVPEQYRNVLESE